MCAQEAAVFTYVNIVDIFTPLTNAPPTQYTHTHHPHIHPHTGSLIYLNEATLLHNLRVRFTKGNIYVSIAPKHTISYLTSFKYLTFNCVDF